MKSKQVTIAKTVFLNEKNHFRIACWKKNNAMAMPGFEGMQGKYQDKRDLLYQYKDYLGYKKLQ